MTQLDAENRALDAVHARVPADDGVMIFLGLTVIAQDLHLGGDFGIVGGDAAAFAERAEIFSGIKTETAGHARAARDVAVAFCAVRLAGVLNDR